MAAQQAIIWVYSTATGPDTQFAVRCWEWCQGQRQLKHDPAMARLASATRKLIDHITVATESLGIVNILLRKFRSGRVGELE